MVGGLLTELPNGRILKKLNEVRTGALIFLPLMASLTASQAWKQVVVSAPDRPVPNGARLF
jgi:hypothetical protein